MEESLKDRKTELMMLLVLGQRVCAAHIEYFLNSACPKKKLICCYECTVDICAHKCFYGKNLKPLSGGIPYCAFTLKEHLDRDPVMKPWTEIKEMLEEC